MESPNRTYVPQVDELRGLAVLLVLVFHAEILGYWAAGHTGWIAALTPLDALVFEGHTGVALFMVLSGFILARGVIGRPIAYWPFLRNRLLRIAPLMVLVVVFALAASRDVTLDRALAPFLLLQSMLPLSFTDKANFTGTVWTISTEFQFYLVAPFLFAFTARDGILRFLLPAMLLALLLKLLLLLPLQGDPTALWQVPYFTIVGRLNQFLLGIGLAAGWTRLAGDPATRPRRGAMLLGIGLVAILLLSFGLNRSGGQYVFRPWRYLHQDIEGLIWVTFVAGYLMLDPLRTTPRLRAALTGVGLISYSAYILHWPLLNAALVLLPRAGLAIPDSRSGMLAVTVLVIVPCVLALSALSYWVVERPFLAARGRYVGPARPEPRPDEPAAVSPAGSGPR